MNGARLKRLWLVFFGIIPVITFGCSKLRDFEDLANKKNSQVSANYPHTLEFRTTLSHGTAFQKDPTSCKTCHGETLTGGNTKVSCTQCHTQYPHSESFKTSAAHGSTYLLSTNKADCLRCHGTKTQVENSKATNCQSCHSYPHDPLWGQRENHAVAYLKSKNTPLSPSGKQLISCKNCHGEDLSGGNSKVSCNKCHSVYPHSDAFKDTDQFEIHGNAYLSDKTACARCHNSKNEELGSPATTCNTCHDPLTHDNVWAKPGNHGAAFIAQLKHSDSDKLSQTSCGKCHSNKKLPETNVKQTVTCTACHLAMPHSADFKNGEHNEIAKSFSVACKSCHKQLKALLPNQEGKGCFNCHSENPGAEDKGPKIEFPM